MPPKTIPIIATTSKLGGNTSIKDTDLQVVTMGQLQKIVNQLIKNRQALKNKINNIKILKLRYYQLKDLQEKS